MKKVWFILLTGMVLLGACQDSAPVDNKWIVDLKGYYLQLDNTDVVIDNASGGQAIFNVYSQDTPWTILEVPEWISLSADRGSTSTPVTVTVSKNNRFEPRVGVFKFSSGTEMNALIRGTEVAKMVLQQKHPFYSIRLKMMFGSVLDDFESLRHVNNLCFRPECTITGYRCCKNGFATKASVQLH